MQAGLLGTLHRGRNLPHPCSEGGAGNPPSGVVGEAACFYSGAMADEAPHAAVGGCSLCLARSMLLLNGAWERRPGDSAFSLWEIGMDTTLTLELPVAGLPSAAEMSASFADEARFLLALKLFEQGRISSGKAGRLCHMGRVEFLLAAGRAGVPVVDMRGDELSEEFT